MKKLILPLGILSFATACGQDEKTIEKPNILFIYADDIGYGDLSCYGTSSVRTPNVEALASEGILFTNTHSAAATSTPSRYGLLTGECPWRREGTGIAAGNAAMIISPERFTLADMFKEAGYNTGVIGKWHLGLGEETGKQDWNSLVTPNPGDLGFDYSYIMAATADRTPCIYMENGRGVGLDPSDPVYVSYTRNFPGEPTGKDNPELLRILPSQGHDQAIVNGIPRIGYMTGGKNALWKDEDIADSITVHAIRFLEKNAGRHEPFFLYLATNDIHVPRVPHKRFAGKSGLGPRGDALLSFDWTVGEVMSTLKRLGLDENTIVVLSSDNGAVVDDGYHDQAAELLGDHKPNGILRGGKYSLYEGGTRVPCILRWKGHVKPGVSDNLTFQLDWMASFAEMCGVKLPHRRGGVRGRHTAAPERDGNAADGGAGGGAAADDPSGGAHRGGGADRAGGAADAPGASGGGQHLHGGGADAGGAERAGHPAGHSGNAGAAQQHCRAAGAERAGMPGDPLVRRSGGDAGAGPAHHRREEGHREG